jgi:protein SCO1/2
VPLDLKFRDEQGREVRLGDYFQGKPVILVLAYYRCPKLCTLVLNGLCAALQQNDRLVAGRDFHVVAVSFDPRELPERAANKKRAYVALYDREGAEEGWHFLTGEPSSIDPLCESVGFHYAYDPQSDQFAHPSAIMVLTPTGKISRYFYGVEFVPLDVRLGLVEAAQEKIGNRIDQALLYCFHYNPRTGKYSANVMLLVRLGGALTLVGMCALGVVLWRRDRRRQASFRAEPTENRGD